MPGCVVGVLAPHMGAPVKRDVREHAFGGHIHELKDGGTSLDGSNVMLRCGTCHSRKAGRARARTAWPPRPPLAGSLAQPRRATTQRCTKGGRVKSSGPRLRPTGLGSRADFFARPEISREVVELETEALRQSEMKRSGMPGSSCYPAGTCC